MEIKQCEENDFEEDMDRQGTFSAWHVLITFLLIIPETTYNLHGAVSLYKGFPFEARCEIPELEFSTWTFEQKRNISQPNVSFANCSYYNYDYGKLGDETYEEALQFTKSHPKPEIVNCGNIVYSKDPEYSSIYKEFHLFCMKNLENVVIMCPLIGALFGYIFIVPLADILGRKTVFVLGLNGLTMSILFMNFASTVHLFILARLVSGIWYAVTKATSEALAVELSEPCFRTYQFFVICIGSSGIVFLSAPFLPHLFNQWRILQWFCSIGILLFPIVKWYVPESPRWLFSKDQKGKAWTIMSTLKHAETQNEALLFFKNDNINFWRLFVRHFHEYEDLYSRQFWFMTVLIGVTGCSYTKNFALKYEDIFLDVKKEFLLYFRGGTEWASLCTCLFLSNVIGRKISALVVQLCSTLLFFSLTQLEDRAVNIVLFYALETTTSTSFALSKLHGIENAPSSHRCTTIGHFGATVSMMTIVLYLLLLNLETQVFFLILGMLSTFGLGVTWFTYGDHRGHLFSTYRDINTRQMYK